MDGLRALTWDCKPDILIRVRPQGAEVRTFVFDAKFRLGDAGVPPGEAVDTVVVYHENIRSASAPDVPEVLRSIAVYPAQVDLPALPIRRALEYGVCGVPAYPGFSALLEDEVDRIVAALPSPKATTY